MSGHNHHTQATGAGDSISLKSALVTPNHTSNNHGPTPNNVSSTTLNHLSVGGDHGGGDTTPGNVSMVSAALGVAGGVAAGPGGVGNNGVGGGRSASTVNLNMGENSRLAIS